MAKSSLEKFLQRERHELLPELEPYRELARELDVFGQAVLGGWCELAAAVRSVLPWPRTETLLEFYSEQASGYAPHDPDPERLVVIIVFGSTVNGCAEDLETGNLRLQELSDVLSRLHQLVANTGSSLYGTAMLQQAVLDVVNSGLEIEDAAPIGGLMVPWQRLAWLTECRMRSGAVLNRRRGEPLIGDSDEQLTYLLRLATNQPGLANWPELARFIPRRADGMLPASEDAYRRFRRDGIPDDPDLSRQLVQEIVEHRHYVLDTISVIELEELGVRRIVLTPEERPEKNLVGGQPHFHLGFLVDHTAGTFSGTLTLSDDDIPGTERRTVLLMPSLMEHMGSETHDSPDSSEHGFEVYNEAQAAVELLLLSAWRDLVVPEVREQHYETDRLRKPKGSGKRAARRGNLEVVRYLPRRLIYRRAAREASERDGRREPSRLYAVSTFARRLPAGQRRSTDAEEFAQDSGIPLALHQTVVRPHFRGGTEDERQAAMETQSGQRLRTWRSWSALDLLRTRSAEAARDRDAPSRTAR